MGDFFETFGNDAQIASKVLNITLTARNKNEDKTPLAGFPHHAIDQYLPKLVEAGYSVVIVDQLEDPKLAKGIVKRGVTRIVTPGTMDDEKNIKNLYIMSICGGKRNYGITLCDISTGKLKSTILPLKTESVKWILNAYEPAEVLVQQDLREISFGDVHIQFVDNSILGESQSEEIVKKHFGINSSKSLGIPDSPELMKSIAFILNYIQETQKISPSHIKKVEFFKKEGTMVLDNATIRNLELTYGIRTQTSTGDKHNDDSLFGILNDCQTAMGRRLLYSWILNPLINKPEIDNRLGIVEKYYKDFDLLSTTRNILSKVSDIERIVGKIGLNRVNARDYKALAYSLNNLKTLEAFEPCVKKVLDLVNVIDNTIVDEPPLAITEGHIIKKGISKEVDELRELSGDSKSWVNEFIKQEREKTGISSLKIGFNSVFGYYIEVTKAHQEKVPDYFIRKQTLVNAERYITEDLKKKEEIILGADEKLGKLEYDIFQKFREQTLPYLEKLLKIAQIVAETDVLSNFAYLANNNNYIRPNIFDIGDDSGVINIVDGRHPVVEKISTEEFISNSTFLDQNEHKFAILTGPNMSGKSTYIRQVALIMLMAQIGSFIPAKSAEISIADRIFTRVGAHDELTKGKSTFMVEMEEASNIANNSTKNSLVILDEIGRGTSTYDGVSIAWALSEYLANEIGARTLFATHYHELLKLEEKYPQSVKNYNVQVEEDEAKDEVIFMRKIVKGGTDRSYGIYVAKMAGLPDKIINRAKEILNGFEQEALFSVKNTDMTSFETQQNGKNKNCNYVTNGNHNETNGDPQILDEKFTTHYASSIFGSLDFGIIGELGKIDTNKLTPIEALNKISEWKKRLVSGA